MDAGEGLEGSPGSPPGGRAPLIGRTERALAGLRAAGTWLTLAAALAVPVLVLPRLGPWAQGLIGSWCLRMFLGVVVFLGLAGLVFGVGTALVRRLHTGRIYGVEAARLVVGLARVWGTPRSREGTVTGPSLAVPFGSVKRIFRRPVAWGAARDLAVGLWYLGEDGRGREIWLLLEADEGERLVARLVAATGLAPVGGETPAGGLP